MPLSNSFFTWMKLALVLPTWPLALGAEGFYILQPDGPSQAPPLFAWMGLALAPYMWPLALGAEGIHMLRPDDGSLQAPPVFACMEVALAPCMWPLAWVLNAFICCSQTVSRGLCRAGGTGGVAAE